MAGRQTGVLINVIVEILRRNVVDQIRQAEVTLLNILVRVEAVV
jgi:hypothetical protein